MNDANQLENCSDPNGLQMQISRPVSFLFLVLVSAAVLAWRAPELLLKPQFWAEDGAIFFAQQYGDWWPHLFAPYWGYLHFLPRLVSWVAMPLGLRHQPFYYGLFGLIIDALAVAYVTRKSGVFFLPIVVWLSLVLAPNDGLYTGYIQNIQWFTQFALVALCLLPRSAHAPATKGRRGMECMVVAACGLTGPFGVLVAGLAGAIYVLAKLPAGLYGMRDTAAAYWQTLAKERIVVLILCSIMQLATTIASPIKDQLDPPRLGFIWKVFGLWSQDHFFGASFLPAGLFVPVILVLAFVFFNARAIPANKRLLCMLLLGMAIAELLLGALKQGAIEAGMMGGDRYYLIGKTCAWWIVPSIVALFVRDPRAPVAMTIGAMFAIAVMNPAWMRRAPLPDMNWKAQADALDAGQSVELRINPSWWDKRLTLPASSHPTRPTSSP
ncbi:hypothetical protein [Dyella sp.]|uniref:hypothetical protein n=1 Tax=Dyella sp. TaxID=1869338 RepID=UPI002ECFCA53